MLTAVSLGGARLRWSTPVATVVAAAALALGLVVDLGLAAPAEAAAGPDDDAGTARAASEALLLIVDYSGSMKEPDGRGSTRIAAAEAALGEIITALPDGLDVGMRVYGHRVPSADKAAACQDTELAVPVGPLDRDLIRGTVDRLEPLGETPIGLSLQQAAQDLPDDVPTTVILVSDGSDECWTDGLGPEPCQVTRDLVAAGVDLRLETIGLQVDPAGREQLECMAEAGGGQFTSVEDAGLLADALAAARNRALRTFEVRGDPVAGGPSLIDATPVGPGTYTDSILDGESLWFAVDVAAGQDVTARVTIRTADVSSDAAVVLEWQDASAQRVDAAALDGIPRGQASTLAVPTGEVNGSRSPFGAVRSPGTYYLSLRTGGFPPDEAHDFVLEILPTGAGTEAEGTPSSPPATSVAPLEPEPEAAPPPASVPAAALPPPPDDGVAPGVVLLLLLVLLAVGGGGILLLRRRRRAQDGAPPPPTYV